MASPIVQPLKANRSPASIASAVPIRAAILKFDQGMSRRCVPENADGLPSAHVTLSLESERYSAAFLGGLIGCVVNTNCVIGEVDAGQRLAPERNAFHKILNFLEVPSGPFLL